jgi:hypothetical protein
VEERRRAVRGALHPVTRGGGSGWAARQFSAGAVMLTGLCLCPRTARCRARTIPARSSGPTRSPCRMVRAGVRRREHPRWVSPRRIGHVTAHGAHRCSRKGREEASVSSGRTSESSARSRSPSRRGRERDRRGGARPGCHPVGTPRSGPRGGACRSEGPHDLDETREIPTAGRERIGEKWAARDSGKRAAWRSSRSVRA